MCSKAHVRQVRSLMFLTSVYKSERYLLDANKLTFILNGKILVDFNANLYLKVI